ncbi:Den1 [Drosophila busckii]|uniref:Den1 n=1 Tax=Drosophila busckii TaxID=30019 RepID=A0A0M3QZ99_DROBS|nr:sentrin-specific protease 8 [Drosophila busckii]ALC49053.1 Den1 [Drosophila busckii]
MPRNIRQKKRAERRNGVQATAAAAVANASSSAGDKNAAVVALKDDQLLDENAMGDGANLKLAATLSDNNNNNNNSSSSNTNVLAVKKAAKASRADPVLASLAKGALRMSDVQLLHGPHWLNDAILNFYFAYLEEVKYKSNLDFLFVTPELSQCMVYMDDKELHSLLVDDQKALRKPFVFIALNDNRPRHDDVRAGVYWSLLVASRPDKSFFHFDSYGGNNTGSSLELVNNIKDVLQMTHARFRNMRCLQQNNDYDCGIHVICMADQLTDYVNRFDSVDGVPPLHQDVIKAKRNQLIKLIAAIGERI